MATARAILTKPLDAALGGGLALLAVGSLLVLRPGWLDALRPHHLALGALLPWEEARSLLADDLTNRDMSLRQQALTALLSTATLDAAHQSTAAQLVASRPRDADPMRQAAVRALGSLPPTRWTAADVPVLDRIIASALAADDLSIGTISALSTQLARSLQGPQET